MSAQSNTPASNVEQYQDPKLEENPVLDEALLDLELPLGNAGSPAEDTEEKKEHERKINVALDTLSECGVPATTVEALRSFPEFQGSIVSLLDVDLVRCTTMLEQVARGESGANEVIAWAAREPLRTRVLGNFSEAGNQVCGRIKLEHRHIIM